MYSSEFHVEENTLFPESVRHHWLVETALNVVVCAHDTWLAAADCCGCFEMTEHKAHN
jgi:prophage antirepressor-like protein